MKFRKKSILLALIAGSTISFISCEGQTNKEWSVTNNSSSKISVEMQINSSDIRLETIEPGETKTTAIYSTVRGARPDVDAIEGIRSFHITQLIQLKKSGTLEQSWLTDVRKTRKVPAEYTHKFNFSVVDGDF